MSRIGLFLSGVSCRLGPSRACAGGLDRRYNDLRDLFRFAPQITQMRGLRMSGFCKQFKPVGRFISLLFYDGQLGHKIGPRPRSTISPIVRADRRGATHQLAGYCVCRGLSRQIVHQCDDLQSKLQRSRLQIAFSHNQRSWSASARRERPMQITHSLHSCSLGWRSGHNTDSIQIPKSKFQNHSTP